MMANLITIIRIIVSFLIMFIPAFSKAFYSLYLIAGLSDILDGYIARRTNTASNLGSKLDTIADITFFIVCCIKIIPHLNIPNLIVVWILIIALIKIISIIIKKGVVDYHSVLNKITGLLLFLFPLTIEILDLNYCLIVICIIATVAAIDEILAVTI